MAFSPAIPLGGLAGLRFLERTGDTQRALYAAAPEIKRDIAYFNENFASITSAEELVADRRILGVVLGSYGLGEEIDKKAFIRRIIEDGVDTPGTLGSRLNNQSYKDMARDLQFDTGLPRTGSISLRDKIVSNFLEQGFETAVGDQDTSLRLALDFKRRSADLSERGWFAFMGDSPARSVLETALNLPSDIAAIDIDKQKELFEERALRVLGSRDPEILSDPATIDKLVSRFLILDEAANGPSATTPGITALTLLQGASSGFGPSATASLFRSSF
jgi:hypothetical protein